MKKSFDQIKIVLVEDDQNKRDELLEILREIGCKLGNIFSTKYAEEAIDTINDEWPDVVLLDLKIPYNKDNESVKIENSNKVIREVEHLNLIRNQEETSTGIIIISATIDDEGIQKLYKQYKEVVDFFDKDDIALDEAKFKKDLSRKIDHLLERDFAQPCRINWKDIRLAKLKPLESTHKELYDRITNDLLGEFEELNNRKANIHQKVERIIGLAGIIVEDIINLTYSGRKQLTTLHDDDNFTSVRDKLNLLTGRHYNHQDSSFIIRGDSIFTRKAAEYASFAYKLRSEAVHSKESDDRNNKLFVNSKYTVEDAAVSISLIMPIVLEFIVYKSKK